MKCMSVDERHDKAVVELYAVTPHSSEPENSTFYKYTPSAELTMEFPRGEVPKKFKPGESYYLDMVRCEKAEWPIDWNNSKLWLQLWGIVLNGEESRQYKFARNCGEWNAKRGEAVPPFKGDFALHVDNPATFRTLGIEGDIFWTFEFTPCKSDYSFYLNEEHHWVLGEPSYDEVVKLSGLEGDVVMSCGRVGEEHEAMTRETFEFREHMNYRVVPKLAEET